MKAIEFQRRCNGSFHVLDLLPVHLAVASIDARHQSIKLLKSDNIVQCSNTCTWQGFCVKHNTGILSLTQNSGHLASATHESRHESADCSNYLLDMQGVSS